MHEGLSALNRPWRPDRFQEDRRELVQAWPGNVLQKFLFLRMPAKDDRLWTAGLRLILRLPLAAVPERALEQWRQLAC
jgi:hypothetical protein